MEEQTPHCKYCKHRSYMLGGWCCSLAHNVAIAESTMQHACPEYEKLQKAELDKILGL